MATSNRNLRFLKEITPVLKKLDKGWFPPDKKTPDVLHHYACSYCDQNCGQNDKHDDDCFYQVAKNILEEWAKIDKDKKVEVDYKGQPRTKKDILEIKNSHKASVAQKIIFKNLLSVLIPYDYESKGVICLCDMGKFEMKHQPDCMHQKIAQIVSNLFNTQKP